MSVATKTKTTKATPSSKTAAKVALRAASDAAVAGKNATTNAYAAALGVSTAAEVRATMADPKRVRVAFVTAEILRPPPSA